MSLKSNSDIYGPVARALHWSIALLFLCLLFSGFLSDDLPKPTTIMLHKATGILVFGLGVLRLLWWAADTNRPDDSDLSWEKWPARLTKWTLAALSVVMPLSGWLMSSASDKPIFFYGLFQVPMLVAPDKALGHLFKESHETLGLIVVALLALHVAGAVRHHFITKDRVLLRMLGR